MFPYLTRRLFGRFTAPITRALSTKKNNLDKEKWKLKQLQKAAKINKNKKTISLKHNHKDNAEIRSKYKSYVENIILATNAEKEEARVQENVFDRRLPESELELRGLALCNLKLDSSWGVRCKGRSVEMKLVKTKGHFPVGGWRRGMLLSMEATGGLEQWRMKKAVLVEINSDFIIVSLENLDSWVLDNFVRKDVDHDIRIVKRSSVDLYNRQIEHLHKLLKSHSSLSPSLPLGCIFNAIIGEVDQISEVETWPVQNLNIYNQTILSDWSKMSALRVAARCPPVVAIHGPPGTGKTTTLAAAVLNAVSTGERVLVTAASHAACDAVTLALASHWPGGTEGRLVRLGSKLRLTTTQVEDYLPENVARLKGEKFYSVTERKEEAESEAGRLQFELVEGGSGRAELQHMEKEAVAEAGRQYRLLEEEVVNEASVVVCTLVTAAQAWILRLVTAGELGLVCVDEAGFTLDSSLLPVLAAAHRLILAGDHLQLPPVVFSSEGRKRGLGTSILERFVTSRPECVSLLTVQYRSHPLISAWSSEFFYESRLATAPHLQERRLDELVSDTSSLTCGHIPITWLDTRGCDWQESGDGGNESVSNVGEAIAVAEIVELLLNSGVEENMVGVISPYWGQVGMIRNLVWEGGGRVGVEINTVDAYQGREKEVILVSFVRSNNKGDVGFLRESRRLNVAVTRARRSVILIGDSTTLSSDPALENLVEFCKTRGSLHSA